VRDIGRKRDQEKDPGERQGSPRKRGGQIRLTREKKSFTTTEGEIYTPHDWQTREIRKGRTQ